MFEAYALVELMGHARIAGKVTEVTVFGTSMLQVDVPKTPRREGYSKLYSPAAVYCITPTDERTAQLAAERFDEPAIQPYILPESPALAAKIEDAYDPEGDYEDDEPDPDDYFDDDDAAFGRWFNGEMSPEERQQKIDAGIIKRVGDDDIEIPF